MSSCLLLTKAPSFIQVNRLVLSHCRSCVACSHPYKENKRFSHRQFYSYRKSDASLDTLSCISSQRLPRVSLPRPLHSSILVNEVQLTSRITDVFKHNVHNRSLYNVCKQSRVGFHTSSSTLKEESKVEKTVKALKEIVKEAEEAKVAPPTKEETTVVAPKKTIPQRLSAAIKHYYHGFRLLFIDIRICSKLIWRILNGQTLTRREYKQLVRTTADMFRLLPMLVFILVPFAEFLLPVVLTLFPNMLPSTFAEEKTEKEKFKKTLKAKIEMAKFLQQTLKESAVMGKKHEGQTESFSSFLDQIRDQGIKPRTKDIMRFAKLFEDEITLDNLNRQQLRACCIMLGITTIGSDALLRFLLQMKLRRLLADDKMIQKEGIDHLTIAELQAANRARGMRGLGVSEDRLREQLKQWMQLHLEEKIPTSLLLLSRALYLPETLSTEEKISVTITQLADTATNEAKVKVAEMSGEKVDNKTKMDVIQHEEAIIAAEKQQMELEAKLQMQAQRENAEAKAAEVIMDSVGVKDATRPSVTPYSEELVDKAELLEASPDEEFVEEASISAKDFDEMEDVLEKIAEKKQIDIDQDALKGLKEEVSGYKEDLEDLKEFSEAYSKDEKNYSESKAAKRLMKKIGKMISRLDGVAGDMQTHTKEKLSAEEMTEEERMALQQEEDQIRTYKKNIISLTELMDAVQILDHNARDDLKLKQIFEVLDQDKDGIIDLSQALEVLELLSKEKLLLKASHVDEVIELLKNEAVLQEAELVQEREEKEKKILDKEQQQQN